MINTEYNYQTNLFKHVSLYNEQKIIYFIAVDINTNLACASWWVDLPPYGYSNFNLPINYIPYLSGIELNAYYKGELISTSIHQWKKSDNRFKFFAPKKELSYGSWHSLVYDNEYNSNFSPTDVVYDLGANFGVYTMWANYHKVNQIYAFEPTPKNVECLKETFKWDDNIQIIEKAISNKNEIKNFSIYPHSVSNSLNYNNSENIIEVECINLEQYINENNLLPPTIIKCDIEGSEYEFLESCSNEFFNSIETLIIEFHLNFENKIWLIVSRLLNLGYSVRMVQNYYTTDNMGALVAKR
jgi:FkbM family methyltransferase